MMGLQSTQLPSNGFMQARLISLTFIIKFHATAPVNGDKSASTNRQTHFTTNINAGKHAPAAVTDNLSKHLLLAICRTSDRTVASGVVGVVVGVCNHSQMRTSKCTCLIFGMNIGLDPS